MSSVLLNVLGVVWILGFVIGVAFWMLDAFGFNLQIRIPPPSSAVFTGIGYVLWVLTILLISYGIVGGAIVVTCYTRLNKKRQHVLNHLHRMQIASRETIDATREA